MPAPIQEGTVVGSYSRTGTAALPSAPSVGNEVWIQGSWGPADDPGPTTLTDVSDNQGGTLADYTVHAMSSLQRSGVFLARRVITVPVVGTFEATVDGGPGSNVRLKLLEFPGEYTLESESSDASGQLDGGSDTINLTTGVLSVLGDYTLIAAMAPRADGSITAVANDPPTGYTSIDSRWFDPSPLVSGYKSISVSETSTADFGAVTWNGGRLGAKLWKFLQTPGGGGDFNATQTESNAGADTTDRSLVATPIQTESSAGVDTTNRTMVTTRAQTESAAGADSQSAVRSLGGQITESASGADSQSAVVTSSRQQTESAAGADSTNRTMTATPVMAESSAGADSQQRTLAIGAAQLETAAGADTQTQATAQSASQVEAGEGTDSSNGFIAGTIAQVESAEATDTQGRSMVATRAQTESSAGVDTQTGARLTLAAITEACAGVDAAWAVLVAVRAMNEVASGADTVLGFQNTGTAMFEACSPADAVASALVATGAQVEVQVATDTQAVSMMAVAQALESATGLDTITGSGGGSTYVVHQDEHGHAVDVTVVMAPPEPGGKYVVRKTRIGYRVVGGDRRFIIYRR